jgi:membrane associated rhomboid family serine protease
VIPLKDDIRSGRTAVVTLGLILVNLLVYLISLRHGGSLLGGPTNAVVVHYGAIPYEFTHPASHCDPTAAGGVACSGQPGVHGTPTSQPATPVTLISSMFLHASPLHLLGNVLFLYIFGNNVEASIGRLRFLAFYVLGGLAALGLQTAVDPNSVAPMIGASGAIAAVLGGYILLYPRAKILTLVFIVLFFTIVELPAVAMLAIWFAEQAIVGAVGLANPIAGAGAVAYLAHVGAFVFGLLLIKVFAARRKDRLPGLPA